MYTRDSQGDLIWVEDDDAAADTSPAPKRIDPSRPPRPEPTPKPADSAITVDRFGAQRGAELWVTMVDGPGGLDLRESVVEPDAVAYAYVTVRPDRAYHAGPLDHQVLVVSDVEGVQGFKGTGWALILVGDPPRQIPVGASRQATIGRVPIDGFVHYQAESFAEQTAALRGALLDLLNEGEFSPDGASKADDTEGEAAPAPDPKNDPFPVPATVDAFAFVYGQYTKKETDRPGTVSAQTAVEGKTTTVRTRYGVKVSDGREPFTGKWEWGTPHSRRDAVAAARANGWLEYGYAGPAARKYDVYASADTLNKVSPSGYLLVDRAIDGRVAAYLRKKGFANRCILREEDAAKYPDLAWGYTSESETPPVVLAGKVSFGRKAKGFRVGQFFKSGGLA